MNVSRLAALFLTGALIWGCAAAPTGPGTHTAPRSGTVAVWDLEDVSVKPRVDPALNEFISAEIIRTVQENGEFTVVEREQLLLVLEELSLGTSDLADDASRLRIGEMLGARMMVFGAFQTIGGQTRVDLRLVEVETGAVVNAAEKTIAAADETRLIEAAGAAAGDLLSY